MDNLDILLAKLPAVDLSSIDLGAIFSASGLFTSLVLIAVIFFVRRLLIRRIWRDSEVLAKEQRSWIIRIKNGSAIAIVIGLILIWAPQLHTFALSIAAFAVAVVVATKEMILCLMGAIMRVSSQPFKAGDWVSIDGVTGEVVDLDAFSFRLQEVDMKGRSYQFTGRTIVIPNGKIFSSNVENANFFKTFIFEDVKISVQFADIDPQAASAALAKITEKYFAPFRTEAQAFNRKIRRRAGIAIGRAEPSYDIATSDVGHYHFSVRLFLPTQAAAAVRSDITADFLAHIYKQRKSALARKEADAKAASGSEYPTESIEA
jgi:small-conductance mechanosensitive channel